MKKIVISIVVVLMTMALSGIAVEAVIRAREVASLSGCTNNLRQISLGVENFRSCLDHFPAATLASEPLPFDQRLSWTFELGPFIHARMDPEWGLERDEPWHAGQNRRYAQQKMRYFLCPANPQIERDGFGITHYVGIAGLGEGAAQLSTENPRIGIFGNDRQITDNDIKDGLTTTLLICEIRVDNGPWLAGGLPTTRALIEPGQRSYMGENGQFGGLHRRGTNSIFADGSVRALNGTIDPKVFAAMATIAGGEQVPDINNNN